jgi:hypothetical protein
LPYRYKTAFMRIYFNLYLNVESSEIEDFIFFFNDCVIPDFDQKNLTKNVTCLVYNKL